MKKTLKDLDVSGKRVLLRVDYNVPLEDGVVTNDKRIRATMPTLEYLREQGAKTIVVTHAGRPKGNVVEDLRTAPIAERLSELLGGTLVSAVPEIVGDGVKEAVEVMEPGSFLVLENVRFDPREKKNDPGFSKELAELADVFVNDGFAVCHRDQASVTGVADELPSAMGFLVEEELKVLSDVMDAPEKPLVAVMGGVKMETRIPMIENFLDNVGADKILLGGAMIFTFFKAQGLEVGKSLFEEEYVETAKKLLEKYGDRLVLPSDVVVAKELSSGVDDVKTVALDAIPEDMMGLDIGPESVKLFCEVLNSAKTIIWNGPMGAFEHEPFMVGTRGLAECLAKHSGTTVLGGGDTAAAVEQIGLEEKMTFVSTGGGASLTLFEGSPLLGIDVLDDA